MLPDTDTAIGPVTLVLGASERPERYANMAVRRLRAHGHAVLAVGLRTGIIDDVPILTAIPEGAVVDTITCYIGPSGLSTWIERCLALNPRRVILNPGTEHDAFARLARDRGIEVIEGCTLVMLTTGTY